MKGVLYNWKARHSLSAEVEKDSFSSLKLNVSCCRKLKKKSFP